MEYALHIFIFVCIYVMLAGSLNLVAGYMGVMSVAHAVFFGAGAYTSAILANKFAVPFTFTVFAGVIVSGAIGVLIGIPSLRGRGDKLVVATFALQVVSLGILKNWESVTGGTVGIMGIPLPEIFGWTVSSKWDFFLITSIFAALTIWICRRIVLSPFGRVLKGIREDEIFVASMGKNTNVVKISVFMISSSLAGLSGVMYAHYISFIDPTSFTVMESIFIISIVIIGGAGSQLGPVLGAVVLVSLPEILRFIGLPTGQAAHVRQIIYGASLVACMLWRPQGLIGAYAFQNMEGDE